MQSRKKGSPKMALHAVDTADSENVLTADEGRELFEREARRLLGLSGKEFLRRWEAGEYRDLPETPETRKLMRVAFLIPFGRPDAE